MNTSAPRTNGQNGYSYVRSSHLLIVEKTFSIINDLLAPCGLSIGKLNPTDEKWIFNNLQNLKLSWQDIILSYDIELLNNSTVKGLEFVFKFYSDNHKPAGICICRFYPFTETIIIEAFENFTQGNHRHPFNGRMLKYILYTLYIYGLMLIEHHETQAETLKIRICQAINEDVLNYYLANAIFYRIGNTMDCETTFSSLEKFIKIQERSLGI